MYLKFLFVEGFKSFPEPSGLELDPGVCVFVGANGTGKSNLTDAVAWALGENDLAGLRSRTHADLIFAGSEELLPMTAGEVTLVLDPRPRRVKLEALPIGACKHGHSAEHGRDIPEGALVITRYVRDGGATGFLVDGVEVSQDELGARLRAAGMGSSPLCTIRQGELERLLVLDPAARRRLFEEAVGIPELGRRHDSLAADVTAARLRRQHLLGERDEAAHRAAALEGEARVLEQARVLEREQAHLRAKAVRYALSGGADSSAGDAPMLSELVGLLGLPGEDDPQVPIAGGLSWERLRSELEDRGARLHMLGPVNTRAGVDLRSARAHLADLDAGLASLEDEIASTEAEVDASRLQMENVFAEALDRVERRFKAHYGLLAPGGEAALCQVDTDAGAGVDIMVRPPGKVLDRVSTLSGGERSLAALSLALAVFQEYDSPIFVLDEVEPALDDTNVRRLQAVLDSVADDRQLLMVSHQQRAKETGDVVFGVERNLDGASQVKFRFEPATRRLDVYRRTWAAEYLRRFPGGKMTAAAPGLAADAPQTRRVMSGGTGSPLQTSLLEIRGPRSGSTGYRPREDGPWEGVWESLGNPDSTGKTSAEAGADHEPGSGKTCC